MGVHHVGGPVAQVEQMAQWLEGLPTTDRETRDKITTNLRAAAAALSAAEKERNGSKLPATQEGREGEGCCGDPLNPYGPCTDCGAKPLLKADEDGVVLLECERCAREGDVIEKLREWVAKEHPRNYVDEHDAGAGDAFDSLLAFLDSLSSEEGL